jgi:ribosome-associated heat shock protein Hsp15
MSNQDKAETKVRIDKWLWAARFFKTRTLAKEAVEGGKVEYNGQRCKPGKTVDLGAELTIRQGWIDKVVIVRGLSDRRQNASIAQTMYEETEESRVQREEKLEQRRAERESQPIPFRRPNKRDRRLIHRFKENQSD